MSGEILLESRGPVTWLTLDRADKHNAITPRMDGDLATALDRLAEDPGCRAVVLRGAGDRAFSAGADIHDGSFPNGFRSGDDWNPDRGARAARALAAFGKPSVVAVRGYCLGGAAELVLHADFRVAATDAVFAFPEVDLGMTPGWGGSQLLPRIVGRGVALDLLLTGRRLGGEQAYAYGLVSRLVARDAVFAEAQQLAEILAAKSTTTVRLVKRAVGAAGTLSISAGMQMERDLVAYRFVDAGTDDQRPA